MTVRRNKRLVLVAAALVAIAFGLSLFRALNAPGHDLKTLVRPLIPFALFAILLWPMWTRLGRLEAEHGADYEPPQSPRARMILIGAALLAAVLSGVAAFLLARSR
jgi:hypothetical protein